ncbi:MAG: HypC/HybG/HupF family hydrogenase formation chaperone [Candidatus Bathyarchaeia archaeon]
MCLAIPAKVVSVQGNFAKVDFGGGIIREVDVSLVDAKVNDYVLVHAGYAIQVLSKEEAQETLRLWSEILEIEEKLERNSLR